MDEFELSRMFLLGKDSVVNFRRLFLSAPEAEECAPPRFHHTWSDILLNEQHNFAVESFRESGKSSILKAFIMHCIFYPNISRDYILIVMGNAEAAEKRLKEISTEYLSNPILASNVVKIYKNTGDVFDLDVKDLNGEIKNIRLEAHGKGSKGIRGSLYKNKRPRLVIMDDLQSIEDAQSDITLMHDHDWFMSDIFFLGKTTRLFIIGNNLGAKCLMERIMEDADSLNFNTMRIPILNELEESAWPSKWPVDAIIAERNAFEKMGKFDVWCREKMCVAMSPEAQIIKESMFKYYYKDDIDKEKLNIYLLSDLALPDEMMRGKSDYSVLLILGVNQDNNWFCLDCDYGRWHPSQFIDKFFGMVSKWSPIYAGLEMVAFQKVMKYLINDEMMKRGIFVTIKELLAKGKKELRISTLQPRFASGAIWFPEDAWWMPEMKMELLAFTLRGSKGAHDDLIDTLAYGEQIAIAPSKGWNKIAEKDLPSMGAL